MRLPRLSKNPRELERAKSSRTTIEPSGVYGGRGAILSQGNPISRRENSFLTSFAPGDFEEILAKLAEGVAVAGELAPPSTSLSKRLF